MKVCFWLLWKCQSMASGEGTLHDRETWQKSCSPHDGQERERKEGTESHLSPQRNASCDIKTSRPHHDVKGSVIFQ